MDQLEGFEHPKFHNKVCKIEKSMNLNKHLVAGIFSFMKRSRNLDFVEVKMIHMCILKLVGMY